MPSQEARDAAMEVWQDAIEGAAPPADAPKAPLNDANAKARDEMGRFQPVNEPVHPVPTDDVPAEQAKPAKEKAAAKPKDPVAAPEKPKAELPDPSSPEALKVLQKKLSDANTALSAKELRFEKKQESARQERAALEQAPGRMKADIIAKLKSDPTTTLKELLTEAGLDFKRVYADHLTPYLVNGERESETERVAKLERRFEDDAKARAERETTQARAAQDAQMAHAKSVFTKFATADEDQFPFVIGMLEESEIADAALGLVPSMREDLGRDPTDVEIATKLDESLRARYLKSEKLKKLAAAESGSTPQGDSERGGAVKTANPDGRKPRTLTNGIAAKPAATQGTYSREQAREAALKLWPSN